MANNIRRMRLADLASVLAIEQAVQAHPWSEAQFASALQHNDIAYVLDTGEVQGYVVAKPLFAEAEILSLAVAIAAQRRGYAFALLKQLQIHFSTLFLEVRPSNLAAQALYKKLGFAQIAKRKAYYGDEDALIYRFSAADPL